MMDFQKKPAIEYLIMGLRDKDVYVRKQSAAALGKIGDMRALEPLYNAVKREDAEVRKEMEKALTQAQTAKKDPRKGVKSKGERVNADIALSTKQIKEMRDLHARGYRESEIAKKLDVTEQSITKHLKGERVRRLEEQYKHIHRAVI